MNDRPSTSSGFSLIELMIAMTVTLIISGAIYGLLTVGQKAFHREPERSDLQQNLRLAMDLITRDIQNTGQGMGVLQPKFAPALDATGNGALTPPEAGLLGSWDELAMVTDNGSCPRMYAAPANLAPAPGDPAVLNVPQTLPPCVLDPAAPAESFVAVIGRPSAAGTAATASWWGWATAVAGAPSTITFATTANGSTVDAAVAAQITDAIDGAGQTGLVGAAGAYPTEWVERVSMVRYAVAYNGDSIPMLFRSASGGFATRPVGAIAAGQRTSPSQGADAIAAAGWEMVARGIEDFQIQYRTFGAAAWVDQPPPVAADVVGTAQREDADSLVVEVRVTLGGRAEGNTAQSEGATNGPTGRAIRSRLVASIVPRSILTGIHGLTNTGTPAVWR